MPRVYTQKVTRVAGEGYISRLQFTREEGYSHVVVSAAFLHNQRALPKDAELYVQTLQRDGRLIDSVALLPNGLGGTQIGLHVLNVHDHKRFQVVVYAVGADVVDGTLTAMHGVTTEASELLKSSIEASGGVVETTVCQSEVVVAGGVAVPESFRNDITPLLARSTVSPNYYFGGVVAPLDRSCQGGVQVLP